MGGNPREVCSAESEQAAAAGQVGLSW